VKNISHKIYVNDYKAGKGKEGGGSLVAIATIRTRRFITHSNISWI